MSSEIEKITTIKVYYQNQIRRTTLKKEELDFTSVRRWISVSFSIPMSSLGCSITYLDTENENVTIGSQQEFEEALKSSKMKFLD